MVQRGETEGAELDKGNAAGAVSRDSRAFVVGSDEVGGEMGREEVIQRRRSGCRLLRHGVSLAGTSLRKRQTSAEPLSVQSAQTVTAG